jgi:FtsP/CotA-like multicopper oxidase with cupredoxin domain
MSPSDDVMRLIQGGWAGDYVYELSADHMGGTLWYHPHHHGASFLQVGGGAFGLLLVDDPSNKDGVPQAVLDMKDRQLVVGFVDPGVAGTGGDTLVSGTLPPTWTVNGKIQGTLNVPANEWQHWRVLFADAHGMMKTLSVGSACEVALMARDGVWRTSAPMVLTDNSIGLTGASRADLAVRCSQSSTISVDGAVVANIAVDSNLTPDLAVGPYAGGASGSMWSAVRPSYLRDLRDPSINVEQRTVSMGARTINGSKFNMDVPTFMIDAGSVQEWTLKGANMHPFHLHAYHVQMQNACGMFEAGEYYDTVAASPCIFRFDLNPATSDVYDGMTMMHCHILDHEDQGAMGMAHIMGGMMAPAYPAHDPPFQEHYQLASTPPPTTCADPGVPQNLTATAGKRAITLNWQAGNPAPTGGYRVYYESGLTFKASIPAGTLTYKDSGLTSGSNYCYVVTAWEDCNGNGVFDVGDKETVVSNTACATAR